MANTSQGWITITTGTGSTTKMKQTFTQGVHGGAYHFTVNIIAGPSMTLTVETDTETMLVLSQGKWVHISQEGEPHVIRFINLNSAPYYRQQDNDSYHGNDKKKPIMCREPVCDWIPPLTVSWAEPV